MEKIELFMALYLLVLAYGIAGQMGMMQANAAGIIKRERSVVAIDSGHGGNDPGKVGVDDSLEKDINLQIATRLKAYLEAFDMEVAMTRNDDTGLYNSGDNNKKVADMRKQCKITNDTKPALAVSIHQNSYHEEAISDGQVFYYKGSDKGKRLAEILQKRFDYVLGAGNRRVAKSNDNYYLLPHAKESIIVMECGFLSNWKEAASLNSEEYQDKTAWTIHMGIMQYLNGGWQNKENGCTGWMGVLLWG